jgi:diguanylate cyclase (GGDEF)-like protein
MFVAAIPMEENPVTLLEASADPFLLCAQDGRVVFGNGAARSWFRLESGNLPLALEDLLAAGTVRRIDFEELQRAVAHGLRWEGRLAFRSESGRTRHALLRVAPWRQADSEVNCVVHLVDISREVERLTTEAERERANLLVDLLGSTAGDLGDAVSSLHWAASLADSQLAEVPSRMRAPMLELRGNARRLHDLFRNLSESMPEGFLQGSEDPEDAWSQAAVRVLLVGTPPVQAAQLLDGLRRANLSCVARTVKTREQALRAAISGEIEVVLLGEAFDSTEIRSLVKKFAQHAPAVAVFDPHGVTADVLVRGMLGAVRDRRRRDQAREAWRNIEEIALRDSLTSVMNRRALDRFARLEFARAERYQFPLALALFDMDYFKELNDSLGHAAGDRALQIFANALQAGVREMDFVARLGGDEFVVLMPHTDPVGALATVQRLREGAERAVRSCLPKSTPQPGASVGFAVYPAEDINGYEDLLARADEALYRAKRNRIRPTGMKAGRKMKPESEAKGV